MATRIQNLLAKLHISDRNLGTCIGPEWIQSSGEWIASYDPATGDSIAHVQLADLASYERTVSAAQNTFATWRHVPAPKRGDVIRDLGNILREYKEPLGELVSLEMGKIRPELIFSVKVR